ncbi:MAG: hypothetical protein CO093_01845 [Alphaproteobacteria bacterium CG_4_9_14_3_um_filter_47_13]|nr:MAG: hypothetical protein CO093_01845 [Alphaproteobacteria bacterium CG_4_9_14_3_um_filter_47_13]
MKKYCCKAILITGTTLFILNPLCAAQAQDVMQELQALKTRQDNLEDENKALKEQVAHLKSNYKVSAIKQPFEPERLSDNSLNLQKKVDNLSVRLKDVEEKGTAFDPAAGQNDIETGYNEGGGGFYVREGDNQLRVLGYVQNNLTISDSALNRSDENGDFFIRRARLDFLANLGENVELLVEIDGGAGTATPGASDFALVEARTNIKLLDDDLQLRAGKFTSQFSTENARSSRSIDTIERYMALNSLFLLPAVDVQFGAMLHGYLGGNNNWWYSAGVYNGNGRANDNLSDDNGDKEVQTKLTYLSDDKNFSASLALDYSTEEQQNLQLSDLGFNSYVSVPVDGERKGIGGDVYFKEGPWSFRSEGMAFQFDGVNEDNVGLYGGFIQPSYFLYGDQNNGLELLWRGDIAHIDADTGNNGDTIFASTAGVNWFINPNTRLQLNGILTHFDGPSAIRGFDGERTIPMLQTELQLKF